MLTKSDLKAIRSIIEESNGILKRDLKEDIINFKDKILTEIQKLREDVAVVTGYKDQIEDHETRIGKIEEILESPKL